MFSMLVIRSYVISSLREYRSPHGKGFVTILPTPFAGTPPPFAPVVHKVEKEEYIVSPLLELVDLDVEQGILQVTEAERAQKPMNFRDILTRQLITRVELRENISKVFKSPPPPHYFSTPDFHVHRYF